MSKLRVKVREPLLRYDGENVLDVSWTAFKKDSDAVYEVPDTSFWRELTLGDNPILLIAEPAKPKVKTKKEEVKSDEES